MECGLLVRPTRGTALLWPNVDVRHGQKKHSYTKHMALPIQDCEQCVKWACNVWIHVHDMNRGPQRK